MTNSIKYVVDTNIFYTHLSQLEGRSDLVITGAVLRELDKHKSCGVADLEFKSRQATRFIKKNKEIFTIDLIDYNAEIELSSEYSNEYADNRILACAKQYGGIISGDLNVQLKALGLALDVIDFDENKVNQNLDYTGIHRVFLDDNDDSTQQEVAEIYQRVGRDYTENPYNLLTNQYLAIHDLNKPTEFDKNNNPIRWECIDKFRFDGKSLVRLTIPKFEGKRKIKPQNEEQEMALDLLNNNDIPIKIVAGTYGSGKTFLAVKSALHHVIDKGNFAKILALRNPIGSGEEIGFLKGTKEDKTEDFFKPIIQQLEGGEQEAEVLKTRGQLVADIPFFIKGQTFTDTFGLVDEAEDLDIKQFKLIGSRMGKQCVMAFVGDVKQAEDKYKRNNGLLHAIETLKGHPLVGVVILSDDVRSEASKVFADM